MVSGLSEPRFCHMNEEAKATPALCFEPIAEHHLRLAVVLCTLWHRVHLSCIKDVYPAISCQAQKAVSRVSVSGRPKKHSTFTTSCCCQGTTGPGCMLCTAYLDTAETLAEVLTLFADLLP